MFQKQIESLTSDFAKAIVVTTKRMIVESLCTSGNDLVEAKVKTVTVPVSMPRKSAKGRKLNMRCRVKGCKARSKGPRFKFLCADHLAVWQKMPAGADFKSWCAGEVPATTPTPVAQA